MTCPRIFVFTPSYRDRECQWTIRDMFEKAAHPERVFAGICWQTLPEEDADCFVVETRPEQVRTVHFHIDEARGLGWARQQAQTLWQGEEYCLQIDSHMRFVPGWDEILLEMMAACDAPEPVLTIYPAGYTPPDDRQVLRVQQVLCVYKFLPIGVLQYTCRTPPPGIVLDRPVPTAGCAGPFIFGPSRILQDVPADPEHYFDGEEANLAPRLWTHGFDLFSPHRSVLYHYYLRRDGSRHWDDFSGAMTLRRRSIRRMKLLLEPSTCTPEEVAALGRYGLGARRSLAEYEDFSGVNYTGRTIANFAQTFPFVRRSSGRHHVMLDAGLGPAPKLHFFILDDEGLLFSETKGTFYRLNKSAAFVWCALEEGYDWPRIGKELAERRGISRAAADRELANLAEHWLGQGLLVRATDQIAPAPVSNRKTWRPRFEPEYFDFRIHTYRLLGVPIEVRYGDRELEHRVHPALAHLETATEEAPVRTLTVARIRDYAYIFCNDDFIHCGHSLTDLAPRLTFELMSRAIQQQDHILQLHAGAVVAKGCLVLLPGAPGSGKTSLTLRLVAAGCTYVTDEAVLLARDTGRIRPVPLSFCVKQGSVALLEEHFPGLGTLPEHDREDNIKVRYLPPPASSMPPEDWAGFAGLVVFPRYVEGAPVRLRPLSRVEAFGRLMDDCVAIPERLALQDAAVLAGFMEGLRAYELIGGDLEAAAARILALCEAPAP
jgi:hypothetical protein